MEQKHIKWSSIEQFRNVVRNVTHTAQYKGKDPETGEAIMDRNAIKPKLKFEGTVKLHGTNAGVTRHTHLQHGVPEMWVQSRENIITPMQDNAGFAMFVEGHKEDFRDLFSTAIGVYQLHNAWNKYITIFGEWCGKGIQKGVAISELPKMFVIFGIALTDEKGNREYFTKQQVIDTVDGCREYVKKPEGKIPDGSYIYCIYDFPTFELEIDFNE